jgi:hypothetical protein
MARRGLTARIPIRVRTPGLIALVLAAGLLLSACGGAADGDGVASAGGEANPTAEDAEQGTLAEEVQALAFAECMRANGVDMPDPAPGQGGLSDAFHETEDNYDRETVEEALAACQDLLPQRTHAGGHDAAREEATLAMAECLREQGLEVPDNLQQQGGLLHDLDDEELRAAMEECRDVLTGGEHE